MRLKQRPVFFVKLENPRSRRRTLRFASRCSSSAWSFFVKCLVWLTSALCRKLLRSLWIFNGLVKTVVTVTLVELFWLVCSDYFCRQQQQLYTCLFFYCCRFNTHSQKTRSNRLSYARNMKHTVFIMKKSKREKIFALKSNLRHSVTTYGMSQVSCDNRVHSVDEM